ncbi:MAG: hypothetical protein HQ582_31290, partial [Planctomycetes bacterium]|nr:hypothetical protein [Planctomycetota bacterium]
IQAVAGSGISDGETFTLFDGRTKITFEFDIPDDPSGSTPGYGVIPGHHRIEFTPPDFPDEGDLGDTSAEVAQQIAAEIRALYLAGDLEIDATASGDMVTLELHGATISAEGFATLETRLDARLQIDPGVIVKLGGARVETEIGAQFIAEGRPGSAEGAPGYKVVFTSILDTRYGAGGTFDTTESTSGQSPAPGDWAGLSFGTVSEVSIDEAIIAFAGGEARIEGGFAYFDPIEIRQAHARVTNTRFENNAASSAGDRNGRGFITPATIYVRGAQPILVSNDFIDNEGAVVSIDVNSLNSTVVPDWGRSTGWVSDSSAYADNRGAMVRENRMTNNDVNGMEVRGGILTTEGVWDDSDIVHVVYDEIVIPNFQHIGGLRLQSNVSESLVVKLETRNASDPAGFTASGRPLEIDDRVGGTLQVVGMPGHPVVMTALADDTIGAGFDLRDQPQFDTDNQERVPTPGDWRSVKLDVYSHDRNVAVLNEREEAFGSDADSNAYPSDAEMLGQLAGFEKAGDDNLRLGFEVHGHVRFDDSADVDVYSFDAPAGTEIWIDVDRSTHAADTIIELINADGDVLARSDNSVDELVDPSLLLGDDVFTMDRDDWLRYDFYTTNQRDSGMRLKLPGSDGQVRTYYVRVRSSLSIGNILPENELTDGQTFAVTDDSDISVIFELDKDVVPNLTSADHVRVDISGASTAADVADAIVAAVNDKTSPNNGLNMTARVLNGNVVLDGVHTAFNPIDTPFAHLANTSGAYQLQVRLREFQEIPGSTVQYSDIRYATNGIEVLGFPGHSPLLGETSEINDASNSQGGAQDIGNILANDRATLSVAGYLSGAQDVDWYRMTVDMEGIQSIPGINDLGSVWATIFDVDYADGMARADLKMWVFDSAGRLVLVGQDSNVQDDRPDPISGADVEDLSRGSLGSRDPFIGTAYLREGGAGTYYVAITSTLANSQELEDSSPLTRREPINSVNRIVSEHLSYPGTTMRPYTSANYNDPTYTGQRLSVIPNEFHLSDVVMYVSTGGQSGKLYTVNPFTGEFQTDVTSTYSGTHLPSTTTTYDYRDIAMRNDGQLYSISAGGTGGGPGSGADQPDYRRFNLEDARNVVSSTATGITFYEVNLPTAPTAHRVDAGGGINLEAMVHDWDDTRRNVYAVGNGTQSPSGPPDGHEWKNLMYVFDSNGVAYTHRTIAVGGARGGARSISGAKIPLGRLYSAPSIIAGAVTQSSPPFLPDHPAGIDGAYTDMDIEDGEWFSVNMNQFEFDSGYDIMLDSTAADVIYDGDTIVLDGQTFEFDSGPVLVASAVGNMAALEGERVTVTGFVNPGGSGGTLTVTFEFDTAGNGTGTNAPLPNPANTSANAVAAAVRQGIGQYAGFSVITSANANRVSLENDAAPRPTTSAPGIVAVSGDFGVTDPLFQPISYEETYVGWQLRNAIRNDIRSVFPTATVGYGGRFGTLAELRDHGARLSIRG